MSMLGKNWAMPVTSRPWAFVASVLEAFKRGSGYRVAVSSSHRAWERAVAPPRGWEYEPVVDSLVYSGTFTLRRHA